MYNSNINSHLDIQGHRGCRGLMPENTIDGCIKAIDIGVTTIELDVVVSKDSQLIVSHEPFFNHEISTHPNFIEITAQNEQQFNMFLMTVNEIQKYDVGLKEHPRFPEQKKIAVKKPTLHELILKIEEYIHEKQLPAVHYNIEIKHLPAKDNIFNPDGQTFTSLVYKAIISHNIKSKCIIQSFDPQCLNIMHHMDADVKTALLVENLDGFEKNLSHLDFTPDIYSPNFLLIDKKLLKYCKSKGIKVIPWTVNKEADITLLIKQGVDGIISDYPERVIDIYNILTKRTIKQ